MYGRISRRESRLRKVRTGTGGDTSLRILPQIRICITYSGIVIFVFGGAQLAGGLGILELELHIAAAAALRNSRMYWALKPMVNTSPW